LYNIGILGGGTNLAFPVAPASLPGILGYATAVLPFPERGDSATGERLICEALGGCTSISSSEEDWMTVMPLSSDVARGLVKFRP
jgi:hypothetical protein